MPSALAAQLAASASLNASLLQDRSKKRQTESYLFTGKDADIHDLDSIHALALNAFSQFRLLSPVFSFRNVKAGLDGTSVAVDFEQTLFSDAAKSLDRTLQTRDVNATLDQNINALLVLLGPWLMDPPSSRILEWLVRRFRINEFNVDTLLAVFLPYHESPHFVKMLSILHIKPNSPFSFLLAFKSAAKPLGRAALIKAMVSDTEVARFVANLLPIAIKCSHSYRTLLSFHTATMHDYISSAPSLDDGVLAFLLPSLLSPLQGSQKDVNVALGSFVLLCALSQKVNLKSAALSAIISAMAAQARSSHKGSVSTTHFIKASVAICSPQEEIRAFPLNVCQSCTKMRGFADELGKAMELVGVQRFALPLLQPLGEHVREPRVSSLFSSIINTANAPMGLIKELSIILVRVTLSAVDAVSEEDVAGTREHTSNAARSLLSLVHQRHLELLQGVLEDLLSEIGKEAKGDRRRNRIKMIKELLASFSFSNPLPHANDKERAIVAPVSSAKDKRVAAAERLYAALKDPQNKSDSRIDVLQALSAPDSFFATIVPEGFSGAWISTFLLVDRVSNDAHQTYASFMQEVYALACAPASISPSQFSTSVLKALFLHLRDSSLAFLLGILLSSSPSLERVRTHALLHILAFIRGHSDANATDFQTVLPSLIAVLLDPRTDKRDRALIFESISLLGGTAVKKHVYGLDTIYGSVSPQLQYADIKDLSAYIKAIMENKEQLIQDAEYIRVFHHQHFEGSNVKYRRRVLCFFLSHVITHPIPSARIALLHSLENVADFSKSHMLLPVIKDFTEDSLPVAQLFGSAFGEYVSLIVSGFLSITSSDLERQDENEVWPVFVGGLRFYFRSNSDASARELYANALDQRLFADLNLDKQSEVCTILLQAGIEGGEVYLASRKLLGKLLRDIVLITRLLVQLQPDHVENEAPINKRAKLDRSLRDPEIIKLQPLSLLAEVLGTTDILGSLDLISTLLETLNKIIRSELWGPSDTSYVCQMLMAAIERSANRVTEPPTRPLRLDVLVELIRVTDNPQTFNEALLLMASLARLTPDSVLHNIMPIFTFMGSNVFHRDDSYSFKVVQHTIDNIVPVMASSLKTKHSGGLELYVGARDFLRIFTDASNHIPRHRRQSFFIHLTEVLQARTFLAPICMLLVDKVANRASRQTLEEAQNTIILPTSLLRHFDRPRQLSVVIEVLKECLRLTGRLLTPDSTGPAFLDYPRDGEHSTSTSATLKRRIQTLILFASTSLTPVQPAKQSDPEEGDSITDVIAQLLELAMLHTGEVADGDSVTIAAAAQTAVERIMTVISAKEFLSGAHALLRSEDAKIKAGALGVISARAPLVTEVLRQECQETMIELISLIRDIIARQSAGSLVDSALIALKGLGSTCCPGEEAALLSTLPHVIKVMRTRTSAAAAIAVLPCYVAALGPRIIPHFKEIAQECILILREGLKGKTQLANVRESALETLQGLLSSLPAFYGASELSEIAKLYVEYGATSTIQHNPLTGLTKAISKRVSADILLPVLCELWPSVGKAQTKDDVNGLIGYFTLLKKALHAAPRSEVLEKLRQIFKVFIEAFDIKMVFGSTEGEPCVISAFTELVVKLNENAFRPLFRRMHDWAFADEKATDQRKITFCHVYTALLDYFRGLINPCMAILLRPLTEVLQSFKSSSADGALWSGVVSVIMKSLEADDGAFWREDTLSTLLPCLLSQLPIAVHLPFPSQEAQTKNPRQLLISCLLSLITLIPSSSLDLVKRLNLELLMHTRSEDARVRIMALECSTAMWKAEGGKLIGFVGETAAFITECAEDENDTVVREAHNLKNAVESVAGSISGL